MMNVTSPLEREAELEQLQAVLEAAKNGHGQVCMIEGPSGVGKTRLLDECARTADAMEMTVLRVRCSELTKDHPFGVVRNLFEGCVNRAGSAKREHLLQGSAALAEPVFGRGVASDEFGVIHGLYWLVVNLAEHRPTIVLVDDLPWADDFSQRCIAYIAERIDDVSIALVCTVRSGDPHADSPLIDHLWDVVTCSPVRPAELSQEGVAALLAANLPERDIGVDVLREVVRQTGGNPFLVQALAEAIRVGDRADLTAPESVRRSIARRLARLDPVARDLAGAGSVLGDDVPLRSGIRLAQLEPDRGIAAAEVLVASQILKSRNPMVFAHNIVRDAVYGLLAPPERRASHARAARVLSDDGAEPEVVAEHLLLSGAAGDQWALSALHDAGRAAMRKGAPAAALRYLRHALEIADRRDLPARLLITLGLAEAATGEPTSLNRFERALDAMTEPTERAETLYSLGQTLYRFGRFAEASVAFHRGAELFDAGDDQTRLRFVGAAWGAETHLRPLERGGELPAATDDGPGARAVMAVEALRQSFASPPATGPAALATRALGGGALLAEQGSQGCSIGLASLALLHCNRIVEANEAADEAIRDARERGALLAYAEASVVRALVLYTRGRINNAAADAQAALDRLQPRGHSHGQTAKAILLHCMIERGELQEAANLAMTVDSAELVPTPAINAYVALSLARLHLCRRDLTQAQSALAVTEEACRGFSTANPASLPWMSLAGVISYIAGDTAGGRELIEEEVRLSRLFEVPIPLGVALQRRAFTESGDQALETLKEAVDVLSDTEASVHLARARAGLGRCLRRSGRRADARDHLRVGLDLAYRGGATGLVVEIREELAAAGGRPRRPLVTGVESLTPTELRIARLASNSLSNRDIAEQIFVSTSTVAWHLRNVYRKLEVESREQISLPADH
jgi:DNA-binding CsgD family transcriptional regulator/tetratricopeptide (TPR) repeat protein